MLHLVGPEHGHDGFSGGEILVNASWDNIGIGLAAAQEVEQNIAPIHIIGNLQQGALGNQYHIFALAQHRQPGIA